jgi:uncharacterized protein
MTRSVSQELEASEDVGRSPEAGPTIGDVIATRLSRRSLGQGLLAVMAVESVLPKLPGSSVANAEEVLTASAFNFEEAPAGVSITHHVAPGYNADILIRWGDAVLRDASAFDPQNQTSASQAGQFGYNNDFVGYLPIDGRSDHGLLVVNHEYTIGELMFSGIDGDTIKARVDKLTAAQVGVEMMAHGGSVIEIKREKGKWSVVPGSRYARRITAETEMHFSGPAKGHVRLRTHAEPTGTRVNGMVNNCSGAVTPWGTWLTCEENTNYYFSNKNALATHPDAASLQRYGVPTDASAWAKFHDRFDIGKEPNEPNRFGWVVEIDPFDPASVPKKRTALGRFKHEGAGNIINSDGRFVVYQGDDERFDYVYKFVTAGKVDLDSPAANRDILDEGTLHVARFNSDGTGRWLALVHGEGPLVAANGFDDQGDVLIHARLASDLLGATKMDRPEDIEVHPKSNAAYIMLTNNTKRTADQVDAANPRPENKYGHIIELKPEGGDHGSPAFTWDILVRCGDPADGPVGATFNPLTSRNGWFANPDNCVIDSLGRLWIATDGMSGTSVGRNDGIFAVETEGPRRGTSKLFFRVPLGAEMCGPCTTPDLETFFVAVQHPGETDDSTRDAKLSSFDNPSTRWPDFKDGMPPRPSVVAITRKGGGKIAV